MLPLIRKRRDPHKIYGLKSAGDQMVPIRKHVK